jgi:hypothetical protein
MNQHLGAAILFNEFTAFIFAVHAKYEFCGAVKVEIIHVYPLVSPKNTRKSRQKAGF